MVNNIIFIKTIYLKLFIKKVLTLYKTCGNILLKITENKLL